MKIRILASIALALAVLAAMAFWTLTTLPPPGRPESPLERAAASGSPEELRREVRLMGGLNATDGHGVDAGSSRTGITPLMLACAQGDPRIVNALLAAGADPHVRQRGEETALTYAMTSGNRRVFEALLRKVPDLRFTDSWTDSWQGRLARILARMRGQSDILDRLDRPSKQAEAAR